MSLLFKNPWNLLWCKISEEGSRVSSQNVVYITTIFIWMEWMSVCVHVCVHMCECVWSLISVWVVLSQNSLKIGYISKKHIIHCSLRCLECLTARFHFGSSLGSLRMDTKFLILYIFITPSYTGLVSSLHFDGMSTFLCYLMPQLSLLRNHGGTI